MKKVIVLLMILISPSAIAQCNYGYTISETPAVSSVSKEIKSIDKQDLTFNTGYSNNKAYVKIKVNNKSAIKISTPRLSNNNILKLVNITF